jgi:DNA modification methylase
MNTHRIILGDCIEGMKTLPDGCVQTCITSPPYFGLRDYGTANWKGGDSNCDHVADPTKTKKFGNPAFNENRPSREQTKVEGYYYKDVCGKCGATCEDSQIGQEDTVEGYVEKMVEVFREVKRILRDDGTLWLNLGDSYMSAKNCAPPPQTVGGQRGMPSDFIPGNRKDQKGLKTKDLIGIPWRVAFALQADGWYLRQDIIWNKPNPMPESVEDRCTKSHEYIFLLSKKPKYYYDHEAIKEPLAEASYGRAERKKKLMERTGKGTLGKQIENGVDGTHGYAGLALGRNGKTGYSEDGKRNKRSVWTVNAKGYKGAHFAVYPENLIEPCVLAGCPKDGTVFDPFTGSGTTAVVALKNGRNYIGTELNPEYVKIAEDRIKESVPQTLSDFLA